MRPYTKWIVAAIIGTQLVAGSAKADETSDAIAALKKQIEALSTKVQQLEDQHTADAQKASEAQKAAQAAKEEEAPAKKAPPFITAGEHGFTMQSADTNFTLKLHGMGQLDSHYYASQNS